jgi:PAS domain S-box-containing protein
MATILIVDDHSVNRQFLVSLLGYAGHRMLEAENGAEALEITRADHPDLIITDILMPVMDGYEFVHQLRAEADIANTPVMFYSATYREREVRGLAKAAGVQYVLSKPAEPQAILNVVDAALGLRLPSTPPSEILTKPLLDPVQIISAKLTAKMGELGSLSSRLSEVIKLGLEIGTERDTGRLLENFCERARQILQAQYAAVSIFAKDGRSLQHFIPSGMDPETVTRLGPLPTGKGLLGVLSPDGIAIRLRDLTADPRAAGFPAGHPIMRSFLGVPISTSLQAYGQLYFTEKIGADEFSKEDERLALILAAQLAVAYENAYLYDEIQRHAVSLKIEMIERRRAEEALRSSEDLFRTLFQYSPVGKCITTLDGGMLQVNKALGDMLGFTAAELQEKHLNDITYHEDLDVGTDAVRSMLSGNVPNVSFDKRYVRKTGELIWAEVHSSLIRDSSGKPLHFITHILNITERKLAAAALAASEKRFRALVEHSPDAVAVNAPDGTVLYASPSVERITGIEAQVGDKVNPFERIHPEDIELSQHLLEQIISTTGASGTVQFRIQHPDGSWRWVEVISTNLIDEPAVGGVISNFSDITARKQAEAALAASEKRFRALVENAPDGIALLGMDGKLQQVTPSTEHILGYTLDEAEGQDPALLTHPEDLAGLLALLSDLIQNPGKVASTEYRFRHKDGSWRWLESTISNLLAEPSVEAIVFNYRDITERKQTEEQNQRQLKYLNALRMIDIAISSSFDIQVTLDVVLQQVLAQLGVDASAILLFDEQLQTIGYAASRGFHSDALHFTKLKLGEGYAGRAILARKTIHISDLMETGGKLASSLLVEHESFVDYYGTPLIVKGEVKGVLEIYHRSHLKAEPEWLEFLETLAGQAALAIDNARLFEDLQRSNLYLEQRVVERTAELYQMNAELEHANKVKDEFLANMSHELRTPLTSILGLSESLQEQRRGSLNDQQQTSLQIIESSGHHLLELINDILDLSKIEAGKFDYFPQPVLVDEICNSSLAFIKSQASKKSITVTYINEATVSKIYADPRRLKQILVNLLTNAVKFTPDKGQVSLQVNADPERDLIQFSVRDTGIGIASEDLQRLFQPFVQLDSSLNRKQEGTGLGLALVQRLTDLHGGSVQVESEVGTGSRFTINLACKLDEITKPEHPLSQIPLPAGQQTEKTGVLSETDAQRRVVLLAEDNLANILTIGDYLEGHGYEVVVAHDGLEAMEKAEALQPDIILMDIQMPGMDGLDATRHLRANPRFASTPIIALTALAMPGDRERCLLAGANAYMSKPVSLKMLRQEVASLLQGLPGR